MTHHIKQPHNLKCFDMIEEIKPGEINYGDCQIKYILKNRTYIINLNNEIISRPYESEFPKIKNTDLIVSKLKKHKNKRHEIKKIEYTKLSIKVRTGFIHKHNTTTKTYILNIRKMILTINTFHNIKGHLVLIIMAMQ